jgi:TusA-related sulfurtransferase
MSLLSRLFGRRRAEPSRGIWPKAITVQDGQVVVDVSGQTCPGYLLAINRAVEPLARGTRIKLIITYPPCGDDVGAWCKERGITFLDIAQEDGKWIIALEK